MKFYHYPACSTCKKALKFLKTHDTEVEAIHLVEATPSADTIRDLWTRSGLELKKFFNTSGKVYRGEGYKDKLKTMSDEEKLEALASNGMLIKRPILDAGSTVLVGFKEPAYTEVVG